jgi:hypothetical protein
MLLAERLANLGLKSALKSDMPFSRRQDSGRIIHASPPAGLIFLLIQMYFFQQLEVYDIAKFHSTRMGVCFRYFHWNYPNGKISPCRSISHYNLCDSGCNPMPLFPGRFASLELPSVKSALRQTRGA